MKVDDRPPRSRSQAGIWVGSIGYERYPGNTDFADRLAAAGVERVIDVRQLPISRRRGFAKSMLNAALAAAGIEYVHLRELGNPKPTRDLYRAGRVAEGSAGYAEYLVREQLAALELLARHLSDRRCALMCVEHDLAACHRSVILDALQTELGLTIDIAAIG